ncbi:hypothetical protein ACF07Y_28620 [Streptomyces sp. NPDC016566]|uniref:hypothetical protein n=1 Tax=Streptomyces sp. NPDC016566 TaxID=3364967 RepID=UPI0036FFFA66
MAKRRAIRRDMERPVPRTRAADADAMQRVGVGGSEKAPSIVAELAELAPLIDKLAVLGLSVTEPGATPPPAAGEAGPALGTPAAAAEGGPLAGMAVVVTGAFPVKFLCSPSCFGARSQRQKRPAPRGVLTFPAEDICGEAVTCG